jgi:hypothetical protein
MGNREYIPCPRSHVVVSFHSSYAFLENNLVCTMLNPLGKKRVRVYTIFNSLLRETNNLRSIHYALRLATIKYSSYNQSISTLFYCISMISGGNQSPTLYLYQITNQSFVLLFFIAKLVLIKIYQSLWDRSCTCILCYDIDLVHLQVKLQLVAY